MHSTKSDAAYLSFLGIIISLCIAGGVVYGTYGKENPPSKTQRAIEVVALEDGTKCAVIILTNGVAMDCNWVEK